jgi:transposase
MDPSKISQVKHLSEVERLTIRQIARELRMCTKTVSRIIAGRERPKKAPKPTLLARYLRLIDEWYMKRPSLKATQVYERLKDYGYVGKYTQVSAYTRSLRKRRSAVYHVDWMAANLPFGKVHGFVFILAWSRYLFVRFYPRSSMEFFLDGHIEACREIGGAARENWYDNLRSVVVARRPEIAFNAQFVDYTRHMGVSIHACNPGKGNEKGRVERAIRDIRGFVESNDFADMRDLNAKTDRWRKERNGRIHARPSRRRRPPSPRRSSFPSRPFPTGPTASSTHR